MAGEDLVVSTGLDLAGLQRDFRRGIGLADQFISDLQRVLSSRDLIGDLTPAGRRAGTSLARGLSGSLTGIGTDLARSLDLATPIIEQGARAGAGFSEALGVAVRGADDVLSRIAQSVDLSSGGERAGQQFTSGIARVISSEAPALRSAMASAIVPATVASDIGRLETTITASLARLPVVFGASGVASGGALVSGIAGELTGARALLTGFSQETSRAITAALTIGDVSGTGERAGRLLAVSVASGITAEAPRVRGALSTALVPSTLAPEVGRITGVFATAGQEIVGLLGAAGTTGGQALTRNLLSEIGRGASALRQLTTGAQIGVVVDPAPIRVLVSEQQKLLTATTQTTDAMRALDGATAAIDPAGIQQATQATRTLADAQREWLREASAGSVAAQGLWQRQRDAAFQAGQQAKRNADEAARVAQQEVAARAQVRAELQHDITALGKYGGQVDATSRRARQAWLAEANAIKQQAREVGVSTAELKRLDAIIDQTTRSFREQEAAARSAAAQIRNAGQSGTRFGPGVVDLRGFQKQAETARTGIARLVTEGGKLSALGTRLAPAMVGVGFALEGIALGGEKAESGLRQVLRQIASFAPFFGPKGFIVAGAAAAVNGVIQLFEKSRDEMAQTKKAFEDDLRQMVLNADTIGLQKKLQDINLGTLNVDTGKFEGGLTALKQRLQELENIDPARALREFGPLAGVKVAKEIDTLRAKITPLQAQFDQTANLIKNFPSLPRAITGLPAITITSGDAAKEAGEALKQLQDEVDRLATAYRQLAPNTALQEPIVARLTDKHEEITRLLKGQRDIASETAVAYRQMLTELSSIDAVLIESTRRSLPGGVAPTVEAPKITAVIDKVTIPAATKITLPAEFDSKELNDSLRRAIGNLETAQRGEVLAKIFGNRQQVAAATKTVNTETANLTRTFKAAVDAELALIAAGKGSITTLQGYIATAERLGITLTDNASTAERFSDTLADVGNAAFAIADVVSQFEGANREASELIGSVGRLANALSDLSNLKLSGEGGMFSSLSGFLEGLPVVGNVITSAVSAYDKIIGTLSGKFEADANRAILKDNTEALTRLVQSIRGLGDTIGDFSTASAALEGSDILAARRGTSGFARGFKNVEALDAELRLAGTSIRDLIFYAERFGITITDASGRISAQGLDALNTALELTVIELTTFSNSLKDAAFLADARREIFDTTDAASVGKDWLEQLRKFAPELFDKFFAGADVATKEGRARFEQGIRDVFDLAALNKLPPELIKMFGSAEAFVEFLLGADRALDDLTDTTSQLNSEMVNVVQGFRDFNLDRAVFRAQDQRAALPTLPPRPSTTAIPAAATASTSIGSLHFSPTIVLQDVGEKDVATLSSEIVADLKRKANAIADPRVKQTVNLLPA